MSDERIDIEINDKIASTIPTKLQAIATNADKGNASVLKLKAALASINDTPARKLKDATDATVSSLNKELDANKNVGASIDKNTASIDKEIAAQKRLSAVIDETIRKREAEKAATLAASGTIGPQFAGSKSLAAAQTAQMAGQGGLGAEAASVGAATRAMETEVAAAEAATVSRFGNIKNAASAALASVGTGISSVASGFKGFFGSGGVAKLEDEAKAATNVATHVRGSSTIVRESLVIMREASQGNFTRMAGSVSILATALNLLPVLIGTAAVAAVGMGAAMFTLNTATQKADLEKYANSLGLTEKEMRKLKDTTVDASGKLHEHNMLQITFGDVLKGVIKTIRDEAAEVLSAWGITTESARNGTSQVLKFLGTFVATLVGEIYAFAKFLYNEVANLFIAAQNAGTLAGNLIYLTLAKTANGVLMLFNGVATIINAVSHAAGGGDLVKKMDYLDSSVSRLGTGLKALKKEDFFADVRAGAAKTQGVFAKMGTNIVGAARDRIKEEADAIKNNRNPHKGPKGSDADPKTKADYLYEDNTKLDNELSRMHLLKDAREEQQRLDQIQEEYIKRRMPLTAAEIQGFKDKIHAIQDYKYVQAEMDKIYENVTGPARTYNAALAAAKELLDKAAISQRDYTRETVLAKRAYEEATDPLFAMKEAMETATVAATKYGVEAQRNTYYEQIRQAELKKGVVLSQQYVAGQNAEVDALMKKNNALLQSQFIQSQVGSIIDPMLQDRQFIQGKAAMYAEIDRLRATDVIKEEEAARAKHAVLAKYDELRLKGASTMFGELAQLSSSKNKQLAAIGKAAAVAQATIDGYLAVQKALSSAPPPWNMALAAATAAVTGANVANILSTNVGNFASGGQFMVEGQAGVDKNNVNMNLSRGERVTIETPQQQRARDAGGSPSHVNVPVTIVNVDSEERIFDHMSTDAGKRVIFNHLRDNPSELKHLINSAG